MTISVRQGNSLTIPRQLKDGQIDLNLTGATVQFMVKEHLSDTDVQAKIVKTSTTVAHLNILDPTRGKVEVYLVPGDTVSLPIGENAVSYYADFRVVIGTNEYNTDRETFTVEPVVNKQG